jgi:uncharacterized protein YjbI with pentapeptide repeats
MNADRALKEIEAANAQGRPAQLADADLRKAELDNAYLVGANLFRARLNATRLNGANLTGANLTGANMRYARLNDAEMLGAILDGANMTGAELNGAELSGAQLQNAKTGKIDGTPRSLPDEWKLVGKALVGPCANLEGASFSFGGDLSNTNLDGARLDESSLYHTKSGGIRGVPSALPSRWSLVDGYLIGPDADLGGADLGGSDLRGVSSGSIIGRPRSLPARWKLVDGYLAGPGANLRDARLIDIDLTGADLTGADLTGADLTGATLKRTILTDADLTRAVIKGADFTGAVLAGVILTEESYADINGAPSELPDGWEIVKKTLQKSVATKEHYDIHAPTSPAFERWFGKSRVVDALGAPLLMYHSTQDPGFYEFDLKKIAPGQVGFYFTSSLENAGTYFRKRGRIKDPTPLDRYDRTHGGIYRLWVRLENPFEFDAQGAMWNKLKVPKYPRARMTYQVIAAAKRSGYDGVIFRNIRDFGGLHEFQGPSDVYVAFSPTQIKSALFNDGSYSLTDPDIRKNPRRTSKRKTSRRSSRRKTSRR